MKFRNLILNAALIAAGTSFVFAQTQDANTASKREETSVENEYLGDVDSEVVLTLAQSGDYDSKLVALQYLENAVSSGNTTDQVIKALDQLAGEGLMNPSRLNGRIINNFPDIRRKACLLLSQIGGVHSKNTLVNIAIADNEPMVQAAAIRALGEMGYNDNDEATDAIVFANHRNRVLNPTSSMAVETLDAFEKLAPNTENKRSMINEISKIASDYRYVSSVRKRALEVLKGIKVDSSNKKSNK